MFKATVIWFTILILAILNGALREKALLPALGRLRAFLVSGALLSGMIFLVALLATPWYGPLGPAGYWLIGIYWVALTVAFEFAFGRLIRKKPWPELLKAYRFKDGNIWPIVLLATLIAPRLAAYLRQ